MGPISEYFMTFFIISFNIFQFNSTIVRKYFKSEFQVLQLELLILFDFFSDRGRTFLSVGCMCISCFPSPTYQRFLSPGHAAAVSLNITQPQQASVLEDCRVSVLNFLFNTLLFSLKSMVPQLHCHYVGSSEQHPECISYEK